MTTAIVLFKLESCAEYCLVANQFGVHKATVKKFVYVFCKGMVSTVIHNLLTVPSAEEACPSASWFHGLPLFFKRGKEQSNADCPDLHVGETKQP